MSTTETFYDDFAAKLVRDFVGGNPRSESAIAFARGVIRARRREAVLDLGCGIGWSSYEFSRLDERMHVDGVDLSAQMIALAKRMFQESGRLHYVQGDLTGAAWAADSSRRYDACVMLDVYEHIPEASRPAFHSTIGSKLTDDAILILTCPTPLHQSYLRLHEPRGIQPVDEDVDLEDVQTLARDTGALVTHFEYKSIWATNDYFNAVLSRNPRRQNLGAAPAEHKELLPPWLRRRHVGRAASILGEGAVSALRSRGRSSFSRAISRVLAAR